MLKRRIGTSYVTGKFLLASGITTLVLFVFSSVAVSVPSLLLGCPEC